LIVVVVIVVVVIVVIIVVVIVVIGIYYTEKKICSRFGDTVKNEFLKVENIGGRHSRIQGSILSKLYR
jgi:hypothetical protein